MSTLLLESLVVIAAAVCAIAYCLLPQPTTGLRVVTVVLSIGAIIVGVVLAVHAGL